MGASEQLSKDNKVRWNRQHCVTLMGFKPPLFLGGIVTNCLPPYAL
jgi:hypothetical protein